MHNDNEQNTATSEVLERIRSGNVRMRSRLYFVLKATTVAVVAAAILSISIFIASFILFGVRVNGHDSLLFFGSRGFLAFLEVFPWLLVLLDVALLVLLEWLLRRFRFVYRRSLVYVFLLLLLVAGVFGLALDRGGFHDDRFEEAERGELIEPFESLYESSYQRSPQNLGVYRGVVIEELEEVFRMTSDDYDSDEDDGTWTVYPPEDFDREDIEEGDWVYVAGDREGDEIKAYGIKELHR